MPVATNMQLQKYIHEIEYRNVDNKYPWRLYPGKACFAVLVQLACCSTAVALVALDCS